MNLKEYELEKAGILVEIVGASLVAVGNHPNSGLNRERGATEASQVEVII